MRSSSSLSRAPDSVSDARLHVLLVPLGAGAVGLDLGAVAAELVVDRREGGGVLLITLGHEVLEVLEVGLRDFLGLLGGGDLPLEGLDVGVDLAEQLVE
jgi:hypothetical protein